MSPPTNIDGTDITGASIDGQDVEEITVDGQTVFTKTLPVAYSNLVAWYPFDSSFYGGSNADDVTALFNPAQSGDSTPYDGTVDGATFKSSGGGTDINAGANSGYFDFDGSDDDIDIGSIPSIENVSQMTFMTWVNMDSTSGFSVTFGSTPNNDDNVRLGNFDGTVRGRVERGGTKVRITGDSLGTGTWEHHAFTFNAGTATLFQDGTQTGTGSGGPSTTPSSLQNWFAGFNAANNEHTDFQADDMRIYDTALTSAQISQIVTNTPH